MENEKIFEYIRDSIYMGIDLYDIENLLKEMGIELSETEKDALEENLLDIAENLNEDYKDQLAYDIVAAFMDLIKDKLPQYKYPEDAPGQLHLF